MNYRFPKNTHPAERLASANQTVVWHDVLCKVVLHDVFSKVVLRGLFSKVVLHGFNFKLGAARLFCKMLCCNTLFGKVVLHESFSQGSVA